MIKIGDLHKKMDEKPERIAGNTTRWRRSSP